MIEAARSGPRDERLSFVLGDVRDWAPDGPLDRDRCRMPCSSGCPASWRPGPLAGLLARAAGWACQVPGNHDQPSHRILKDLAGSARWRPLLARRSSSTGRPPSRRVTSTYCPAAGCVAEAWKTTYFTSAGDNPVLEWYKGTGLRPVLDACPASGAGIRRRVRRADRAAYPARPTLGAAVPPGFFATARRVSRAARGRPRLCGGPARRLGRDARPGVQVRQAVPARLNQVRRDVSSGGFPSVGHNWPCDSRPVWPGTRHHIHDQSARTSGQPGVVNDPNSAR